MGTVGHSKAKVCPKNTRSAVHVHWLLSFFKFSCLYCILRLKRTGPMRGFGNLWAETNWRICRTKSCRQCPDDQWRLIKAWHVAWVSSSSSSGQGVARQVTMSWKSIGPAAEGASMPSGSQAALDDSTGTRSIKKWEECADTDIESKKADISPHGINFGRSL